MWCKPEVALHCEDEIISVKLCNIHEHIGGDKKCKLFRNWSNTKLFEGIF